MEREITDVEMDKLVKLKHLSEEHFRCCFTELFGKNVTKDDVRIYLRAIHIMEKMDEFLMLSR